MKPLIYYLLIVIGLPLFGYNTSHAQEINDEFFKKNLLQDNYPIDPDANAVILFEKTTIEIKIVSHLYQQVEKVHRIIKILKTDGEDCANIRLYYPAHKSYRDYIYNINAKTYYLSNDSMFAEPLQGEDIYTRSYNDEYDEFSFSLPSAKEGDVIEYSYEQVNNLNWVLPHWEIQGEYPKLRTEYGLTFPTNIEFTSINHSRIPFKEFNNFEKAENSNDTSYHVSETDIGHTQRSVLWVRRNVPAIKEEPFVNNEREFQDGLDVQLTGMGTPEGPKYFDNSWEKMNDELWKNERFGKQITEPNSFLTPVTDSISKLDTSIIGRAKLAYSYIRSNFTSSANRSIYASTALENLFKKKTGSEAEINLLLAAMLRHIGIAASPLLLSTWGNIPINKNFPVLTRFNYVACIIPIGNGYILLDASGKQTPFNSLPPYCYNGYARLIDKQGIPLYITPDNEIEKNIFVLQATYLNDTLLNLNVTEKLGMIVSVGFRKKNTENSDIVKDYINDQIQSFNGEVSLKSSKTENMDNPDTNLIIKYTCEVKEKKKASMIYMNTDFIRFFKENPFKSHKRLLPIEFPNQMEYISDMNIIIPSGMLPDDLPKTTIIECGNGQMEYKKLIGYNSDLHMISVNASFRLNKTSYPAEDYDPIRSFFTKMVQEENNMLTFKTTSAK